MGFFRNIFGGNATEPVLDGRTEDLRQRRSTGFHEFIRYIDKPSGQVVLDLGATSPANLQFITGLDHRAYNEDLMLAASDPGLLVETGEEGVKRIDTVRFLSENLNYDAELFDAVLLWDLADYLPEALVKPVIERLHHVMKPKGILFGFFHTKDAGPEAPHLRFNIVSPNTLDLRPGAGHFRLQRVFNNRHIENLFHGYKSIKFFLGRDNLREVLVIR